MAANFTKLPESLHGPPPMLKVSHTGHALRHSFRTLAAAAGIDRLRLKILMNHAIDRDVFVYVSAYH
jgi:integrase